MNAKVAAFPKTDTAQVFMFVVSNHIATILDGMPGFGILFEHWNATISERDHSAKGPVCQYACIDPEAGTSDSLQYPCICHAITGWHTR